MKPNGMDIFEWKIFDSMANWNPSQREMKDFPDNNVKVKSLAKSL